MFNSALPPATAPRVAGRTNLHRFPHGSAGFRRGGLAIATPAAAVLGSILLATVAAAGIGSLTLPQQSSAFAGSESGIPWLGLLGWKVVGSSNATSQASANVLAPSTVGTKSFNANSPVNSSAHVYVEVLVQVSSTAPANREFTLWLVLNGSSSASGTNLPGASPERFFAIPSLGTKTVTVTLFYELGTTGPVYRVTSVALLSALCPSMGACP